MATNVMYGDADLASGAQGGNDKLDGGNGDDQLWGDWAKSITAGEGGNDILNGGAGSDLLAGGGGNDKLTGGSDSDTFAFDTGSGQDRITDFEVGTSVNPGDVLDLSGYGLTFASLNTNGDDVVGKGDDFVTTKGNSMSIDLGAASGGAPDIDTLVISGTNHLDAANVA